MTLHIAGGVKIVMKNCRKISKFFTPKIFLTEICVSWHISSRNDLNKNFQKIQNFDPPNFWTPLIFKILKDHVTLHPCTKFGVSRSKGVGARGHKAEKTEKCPEGTILTPRGRHLQGRCAIPLRTYPESFKSFRRILR